MRCDHLYLVGDIVEGWTSPRQAPEFRELHGLIQAHVARGTEVTYILGNHDEFLAPYAGQVRRGVRIVREAIHRTIAGDKALVVHGDQFDLYSYKPNRWQARIGAWLARIPWLLWLFDEVSSLAAASFVRRACREAERHGARIVVCGHTHRPRWGRAGDITYVNCGDWLTHHTALIEHDDGRLELSRVG